MTVLDAGHAPDPEDPFRVKVKIIRHAGNTSRTLGELPPVTMLGEAIRTRASHVEPVNPVKRLAFRILRLLFSERGRVADWTRSWSGPWQARLVGSSRRYMHPSRRACLDWERRELERKGTQ